MDNAICDVRRVTTPFLMAIPALQNFDAYLYAILPRKLGTEQDKEYGKEIRINPCTLNLQHRTITSILPLDVNPGIKSINDLPDNWFDSIQASFVVLITNYLS